MSVVTLLPLHLVFSLPSSLHPRKSTVHYCVFYVVSISWENTLEWYKQSNKHTKSRCRLNACLLPAKQATGSICICKLEAADVLPHLSRLPLLLLRLLSRLPLLLLRLRLGDSDTERPLQGIAAQRNVQQQHTQAPMMSAPHSSGHETQSATVCGVTGARQHTSMLVAAGSCKALSKCLTLPGMQDMQQHKSTYSHISMGTRRKAQGCAGQRSTLPPFKHTCAETCCGSCSCSCCGCGCCGASACAVSASARASGKGSAKQIGRACRRCAQVTET